jgi:hypothetical protein
MGKRCYARKRTERERESENVKEIERRRSSTLEHPESRKGVAGSGLNYGCLHPPAPLQSELSAGSKGREKQRGRSWTIDLLRRRLKSKMCKQLARAVSVSLPPAMRFTVFGHGLWSVLCAGGLMRDSMGQSTGEIDPCTSSFSVVDDTSTKLMLQGPRTSALIWCDGRPAHRPSFA